MTGNMEAANRKQTIFTPITKLNLKHYEEICATAGLGGGDHLPGKRNSSQ